MSQKYQKSLFIFRRDLRLEDNTGLLQALEQSKEVIPCFIFDPCQVEDTNPYRSMNALQFMIESLQELETHLESVGGKLYLFYGSQQQVVEDLITNHAINAVFCNRDYTPFAIKRDELIHQVCNRHNAAFNHSNDYLLNEPEDITSGNGTPYVVYTAFLRKSVQYPVRKPAPLKKGGWHTKQLTGMQKSSLYKKIVPELNKHIHVHGGASEGIKILKHIKNFKNYTEIRDLPALDTTNLSAHLKFGTVSIRQTHQAICEQLSPTHQLIRQLYWRDFFTHIAYHSPFVFGSAFHQKYNSLPWENDPKKFEAWCKGMTGFPIVDAGMRQLNETGFMHNRVRMIVGSLLTKDLHIDWRWAEKYFAQQLVDYDPSVNNGNWQWVASTGCDAQPYFRIFNPWLQQKKFDPECVYIKRWVPELKLVPAKVIHAWFDPKQAPIKGYPRPIVDHGIESKKAKTWYAKVAKNDDE